MEPVGRRSACRVSEPRLSSRDFRLLRSPAGSGFRLQVEIVGWNPFEPGDPDNSSLPVAALDIASPIPHPTCWKAVFSFNARNFMVVRGGTERGAKLPMYCALGAESTEKSWRKALLPSPSQTRRPG